MKVGGSGKHWAAAGGQGGGSSYHSLLPPFTHTLILADEEHCGNLISFVSYSYHLSSQNILLSFLPALFSTSMAVRHD